MAKDPDQPLPLGARVLARTAPLARRRRPRPSARRRAPRGGRCRRVARRHRRRGRAARQRRVVVLVVAGRAAPSARRSRRPPRRRQPLAGVGIAGGELEAPTAAANATAAAVGADRGAPSAARRARRRHAGAAGACAAAPAADAPTPAPAADSTGRAPPHRPAETGAPATTRGGCAADRGAPGKPARHGQRPRARALREREARAAIAQPVAAAVASGVVQLAISPWGQVEVDGQPRRHLAAAARADARPRARTASSCATPTSRRTSTEVNVDAGAAGHASSTGSDHEQRPLALRSRCAARRAAPQTAAAAPAGLMDVTERPAEKALLAGMRAYDDAQYPPAEAQLTQALQTGLASATRPRHRAQAPRVHLLHQRTALADCEAEFRAARAADPAFALSKSEVRPPAVGPGLQKAAAIDRARRRAAPAAPPLPERRTRAPRRFATRCASTGKTPTPAASSSTPTT